MHATIILANIDRKNRMEDNRFRKLNSGVNADISLTITARRK